MNRLPKYWAVKNNGSSLFKDSVISYINKIETNKRVTWSGCIIDAYYGFDGRAKSSKNLSNFNYSTKLLTIEEFIELSKEIDDVINFRIPGTKLPEIPKNTEFRCTLWEAKVKNSFFYNDRLDFVSHGSIVFNGECYIKCENNKYKEKNYYMIKESDIIKLYEQDFDKELIGYKCPFDLFEGEIKKGTTYRKVSYSNGFIYTALEQDKIGVSTFNLPKEIVETWEPIFVLTFKKGTWVALKDSEKIFKVVKFDGLNTYTLEIDNQSNYTYCHKDKIRLATPEEIRKAQYPDIEINGYKAEFFDDYVKFGCAKISKDLIFNLYSCISKSYDNSKKIESVKIGEGTFNIKSIKAIFEYYKNNEK